MGTKVIILGAGGQIGSDLVKNLRQRYGVQNVVAADLHKECPANLSGGPYVQLDVLNRELVRETIINGAFDHVYLLAALLSATAEKNPDFAWKLNMEGLFTILDLAKEGYIKRIFWPSSIAVFGPTTPKVMTPQYTVMEPTTVYGISKLAGERWCEYYFNKFNVDVRSIRYPGLISHTNLPGGGTTDYAVDIFYHAKKTGNYTAFLGEDTALPMLYMDDAIRATIELMEAPADQIKIRSSYNLGGLSFTPKTLGEAISKQLPDFQLAFNPDFRQQIADSWPDSIDDSSAQEHWGWKPKFLLDETVRVMLENVDISKMKD